MVLPACSECNHSWENDEPHFRNMLVLAGEKPNPPRRELWETVLRSFEEVDGPIRLRDLTSQMRAASVNGRETDLVFPGKDERVLRVVRKIIRGLCHYHKVLSPVSDERVWCDVLKYVVPPGLLEQLSCHHREQDIVEYRYEVSNENEVNSAWLLTFFESVTFIGAVSSSESGLVWQQQAGTEFSTNGL